MRIDEVCRFGNVRRPAQHKDPFEHLMQEGREWVEEIVWG